jgi:hypothetical protein
MLRSSERPSRAELAAWTDDLVRRARRLLAAVLPLTDTEARFVAAINDYGEVRAELLSDDETMRSIIARHPALLWKAKNVRDYRPGREARGKGL